jgi:hypothetical protein
VTNAGKTKFLERLQLIFPCESYVQQHGSPFDIDYKQQATYDHSRFKPSFILIEEGSFSSLIDNGAIEDLKLFLEGKGKSLKTKHVTSSGMQWVDVPILMTTNTLHEYMQADAFTKERYINQTDRKRCEDNEAHRKALKNRMEIVHLYREHSGKTKFPYDEIDLALYMYDLHLEHKIVEVKSDLLILEDDNDEVSFRYDEKQIN